MVKAKERGKKYTFVCEKHKRTTKSAFGATCPICRKTMKCLGTKWRIGRNGNFTKVERKTRNLAGQKFPYGTGPTSLAGVRHRALMKKWREQNEHARNSSTLQKGIISQAVESKIATC